MSQLLVVVIPGVVAVELFHVAYPATRRDWLSILLWVAVWGSVGAAAALWFDTTVFDGAGGVAAALADGQLNVGFVFALLIAGLVAGGVRIGIRTLRFLVARSSPALQWLRPDHPPVWVSANMPFVNDDWAVVYLHDGAIYLGWIAQFSYDPRRQHHEFVLQDARRLEDDLGERYRVAGSGVYLTTGQVARIEYWTGKIES